MASAFKKLLGPICPPLKQWVSDKLLSHCFNDKMFNDINNYNLFSVLRLIKFKRAN